MAVVTSGRTEGIVGRLVRIDVEMEQRGARAGLKIQGPQMSDAGRITETRVRVTSALGNYHRFGSYCVTVGYGHAAPTRDSASFDLPIALGILVAEGRIPAQALRDTLIIGELALNGDVRHVRGVLAIVLAARDAGMAGVFVPACNAREALMVEGIEVFGIEHLAQVVDALNGREPLPEPALEAPPPPEDSGVDLADVRGQKVARRALEIAAAGGHNIILNGPVGSGKTMLARRLPTILPEMTHREGVETACVASVVGLLREEQPLVARRPFRAPHHSASDVALAGGGPQSRPGEVSLAHNGVLFLDDLPEFRRSALETLRQPLEDGHVVVAGAQATTTWPARFMLVASMSPCPCGHLGNPRWHCDCAASAKASYRRRIEPYLDMFDIRVTTARQSPNKPWRNAAQGESSEAVRARVTAARAVQAVRFDATRATCNAPTCNAQMGAKEFEAHCVLDDAGLAPGSSPRAHDRTLKVARTIADMAGAERIDAAHLCEAAHLCVG